MAFEFESEQVLPHKQRRSKPRKWREIEAFKDRERLRRELSLYDGYDYKYEYDSE
ncbi:MAG: DUF3545 family protein [Gammaproteobacteria bacterium]|nr:DUF3545 family protein [Gammaproteobacteria bacterium]